MGQKLENTEPCSPAIKRLTNTYAILKADVRELEDRKAELRKEVVALDGLHAESVKMCHSIQEEIKLAEAELNMLRQTITEERTLAQNAHKQALGQHRACEAARVEAQEAKRLAQIAQVELQVQQKRKDESLREAREAKAMAAIAQKHMAGQQRAAAEATRRADDAAKRAQEATSQCGAAAPPIVPSTVAVPAASAIAPISDVNAVATLRVEKATLTAEVDALESKLKNLRREVNESRLRNESYSRNARSEIEQLTYQRQRLESTAEHLRRDEACLRQRITKTGFQLQLLQVSAIHASKSLILAALDAVTTADSCTSRNEEETP